MRDKENGTTSLSRALGLLTAFQGISPPLSLSELARRAGLPKSTAFRFLTDLEDAGFVERDSQGYQLGLPLFELGSRVPVCRPNGLRDIAMHQLSELHVTTGLNAHLAVPDGTDVVYVAKVNRGQQTLRNHFTPGARHAASCDAPGKAILAFSDPSVVEAVLERGLPRRTKYSITEPRWFRRELERIRANGVAFEQEEASLGIAAVAAPVLVDGQPVGAVSVSQVPPIRNPDRLAAQIKAAAAAISRDCEATTAWAW
ncbi:MAG: IclR family transcriptional regulator [Streptosporangiales bacterium]|nr:IclR family transcriptional regulator [Streptosporangiales bacterium]